MDLIKYDINFSLNPVGFNNIGFTCYYNSLLQSLLSCTSFVEELIAHKDEQDGLIKLLNYLIDKLTKLDDPSFEHHEIYYNEISNLGPITWKYMVNRIAKKSMNFSYMASGQQCAAEGFSLLLQSIEEYHNIQNLFLYRRRNKLYCEDCKNYFSQIDEMNNIFEVEPHEIETKSFSKNLNEFLLNQKNNVDSNCRCSKCGTKSEKQKTSTLVMVPEILFVMAKKYKYNNGQSEKLDIYTDFPEILTFNAKKNTKLIYRAVAQIEHIGNSIHSGHYYAICKRKNKWYCINDTHVSEAEFKPTNNTYIVIYHIF